MRIKLKKTVTYNSFLILATTMLLPVGCTYRTYSSPATSKTVHYIHDAPATAPSSRTINHNTYVYHVSETNIQNRNTERHANRRVNEHNRRTHHHKSGMISTYDRFRRNQDEINRERTRRDKLERTRRDKLERTRRDKLERTRRDRTLVKNRGNMPEHRIKDKQIKEKRQCDKARSDRDKAENTVARNRNIGKHNQQTTKIDLRKSRETHKKTTCNDNARKGINCSSKKHPRDKSSMTASSKSRRIF